MNIRGNENFASAAMVRVLVRGMVSRGFRLPELAGELTHAKISLNLKRAVIKAAVEQGGLACLPLLGRGLHDLAMEPTHLALTAGRNAASMFVRWQRLERFIHSEHRIRLLSLESGSAIVEHVHKNHGPKPLPFEDLVVCGVLCALLEANGLDAVRALANKVELFPNPNPERINACAEQTQTARWVISWQDPGTRSGALDLSASWALTSPPIWTQQACAIGDLIARRLPELLPLDAAASEMGMSRRGLQRALATEGLSYQQLMSEVRFRLAAWHLLQHDMAIAEIGFVCGYSDQAHLTREFNRRVGVPPAKYRSLFGLSG